MEQKVFDVCLRPLDEMKEIETDDGKVYGWQNPIWQDLYLTRDLKVYNTVTKKRLAKTFSNTGQYCINSYGVKAETLVNGNFETQLFYPFVRFVGETVLGLEKIFIEIRTKNKYRMNVGKTPFNIYLNFKNAIIADPRPENIQIIGIEGKLKVNLHDNNQNGKYNKYSLFNPKFKYYSSYAEIHWEKYMMKYRSKEFQQKLGLNMALVDMNTGQPVITATDHELSSTFGIGIAIIHYLAMHGAPFEHVDPLTLKVRDFKFVFATEIGPKLSIDECAVNEAMDEAMNEVMNRN